jgi:uncharacterized OB-fold protein
VTVAEGYEKLVPEPTADTKPFWDALHARKFRLQRCADCKKIRHYPRPVCDACFSMNAEWVDASGRGTVHSWTITHHAFHPALKADLPFTLLTVDLEEGVRMQAQSRGIAGEELRTGLPVKLGFEAVKEGLTLPVFEKA